MFDVPSLADEGDYARKHSPWTDFRDVSASANQPLSAMPDDYANLPTVSFLIPNLCHDMHDCSIAEGDRWLAQNIDDYATWARTHNSLLLVTFDESDSDPDNHIATLAVGQGSLLSRLGGPRRLQPGYPRVGQHRPGHQWCRESRRGERGVAEEEVGGLLREHHRGSVRGAVRAVRHGRRVDHADRLEAVHLHRGGIEHRSVVGAHPAGRCGVHVRLGGPGHPVEDLPVRLDGGAG